MVVRQGDGQRGLVRAGVRGQWARPAHQHEPRHRARDVLDRPRQHGQAGLLGHERGAHGGVERLGSGLGVREGPRRGGGGSGGGVLDAGQVRLDPAAHLRPRVGVRGHAPHVRQLHAGPAHQHEADLHELLAEDLEVVARGDVVQGGAHAALHGVLDRHHGVVGLPGPDGRERGRHGRGGDQLGLLGARHGPQRGLREGARGAQEGAAPEGRGVVAGHLTVGSAPPSASMGLPASSHAPEPPATLMAV